MDLSVLGATVGVLAGLAGGVCGTYFSIKNTTSRRERLLMLQMAAVTWAFVLSFVALLFVVDAKYKIRMWSFYVPALVLLIFLADRRQRRIRQEDRRTGV